MERFALAGLLVVFLPSLTHAQRIEVALFAGGYQSAPALRSTDDGDICDSPPCPTIYENARSSGPVLGGRVSIQVSRRFGVDAILQRAATTSTETYRDISPGPAAIVAQAHRELVTTSFSLQTHLRSQLTDRLDVTVGAGPAVTSTSSSGSTYSGSWEWPSPPTAWQLGLALTGSVRATLARSVAFELNVSNTHVFGRLKPSAVGGSRNHLTAQAGLGLAFGSKL